MRKFTRTEGAPVVVSPEAHQVIQTELDKLGKTSARELSDSQRQTLGETVDESEDSC